jgi:hypothetical protein
VATGKLRNQKIYFTLICLLLFSPTLIAQQTESADITATPPAPVTEVVAFDTPNDAGSSITIRWKKSPDDTPEDIAFVGYKILRAVYPDGEFEQTADAPHGAEETFDNEAKDGVEYTYRIRAVRGDLFSDSEASTPAQSKQQWFHTGRINTLIGCLIIGLAILFFISRAKAGKELYIRKIAGLEAVDEAVGRATEMGRKIFFIPGIQDIYNLQTIAGVIILGRVAKLVAEYDAQMEIPVSRSMVMVACRETVKEAYLNAGRPDAYKEDAIHYLTDEQFGYAAGVDGLIVREKPATIFYQGAFFAESLILAETGNYIGAIQIAGTAMPAQLPFFVAACDYTLIGEELFAASAYLSKEPKLLGSLKGQDVGKVVILLAILIGVIVHSFGLFNFAQLFRVQ